MEDTDRERRAAGDERLRPRVDGGLEGQGQGGPDGGGGGGGGKRTAALHRKALRRRYWCLAQSSHAHHGCHGGGGGTGGGDHRGRRRIRTVMQRPTRAKIRDEANSQGRSGHYSPATAGRSISLLLSIQVAILFFLLSSWDWDGGGGVGVRAQGRGGAEFSSGFSCTLQQKKKPEGPRNVTD